MAESQQPPRQRPGQQPPTPPGQPGAAPQQPQGGAAPAGRSAAAQQAAAGHQGAAPASGPAGRSGPGGPGWPSGGMWQPPGTIRPVQRGIVMHSGAGVFQTQVFYQPAPGVEGDFCDHNPRTTVNAGPGGLVAGEPGVMVGRFAWFDPDSPLDPNDAPKVVLSYTEDPQPVVGFVHREQQGLITHYLGGAGMWVPPGFMITLHQTGGFFVRNNGDARAELGMAAFAFMEDGAIAFAARGGAVTDAVETKWFAASAGEPGTLIKMSSWPLG